MLLSSKVRKSIVREMLNAGLLDKDKVKISRVLEIDDDYYKEFVDAYMAFKQTEGLDKQANVVKDEIEKFRQEHGFRTYKEAEWVMAGYLPAKESSLCKGRPLFEAIKDFIKNEVVVEDNKKYFPPRKELAEPELRFMQLALNYASFSELQKDCYLWYTSIVDIEDYFFNWIPIKEMIELMQFFKSRNAFRKVYKHVAVMDLVYETSISVSYTGRGGGLIRADLAFMINQLRHLWGLVSRSSLKRFFSCSLFLHGKATRVLLKGLFSEYKMTYLEWYNLCKSKSDLHTHPKRLLL
jgi:hypothetical protein